MEVVGGRDEDAKLKAILSGISAIQDRHDSEAISASLREISTAGLCPVHYAQALDALKRLTQTPISALKRQMMDAVASATAPPKTDGDAPQKNGKAPPWRDMMTLSQFGSPHKTEGNVLKILKADRAFGARIYADEFTGRPMVAKRMPWSSDEKRQWTDVDDVRLVEWLLDHAGLEISVSAARNAVLAHAHENIRNPVREYLSSLQWDPAKQWDGRPRLDTWATYYLGADATPFVSQAAAKWMISAVARIFAPGCQADHMIVLEGPQGIRKSTALNVLAGPGFFTDDISDISNKDALMQMSKFWIIELAEMEAFRGREASKVRAFLTRRVDTFRPPYGRSVVDVPRHCVFAGTVNTDTWIQSDGTGGRRFWPIRCKSIDIDALRADRDQLWAEAVSRYHAGERWYIDDPDIVSEAKIEQTDRELPDEWAAIFERYITENDDGSVRFDPIREISIRQFLTDAIGIKVAEFTRADEMRAAAILKSFDWRRRRTGSRTSRSWRYYAPDGDES